MKAPCCGRSFDDHLAVAFEDVPRSADVFGDENARVGVARQMLTVSRTQVGHSERRAGQPSSGDERSSSWQRRRAHDG